MYQIVEVDLSSAHDHTPILDRGVAFDSLTVIQADASAIFSLGIGDGQDIPFAQGQTWEGDVCAPESLGLYLTAVAQAGIIIKIYVALGSSLIQQR